MPPRKTVEFVKITIKNTIIPLNKLIKLYPDSEEVIKLVKSINDISDLCNFEIGKFISETKIFNLEACILEVMHMYPEKKYSLQIADSIPDFIEGSRDSLQHLMNLIVRNSYEKITIKIKACKYYKNKQLKILIEVCNIRDLNLESIDRFMIDNIISIMNGDFWEERDKCFSLYVSFTSIVDTQAIISRKEKFKVVIVITDTDRRIKLCTFLKALHVSFVPFSSEEEYFITPLNYIPDIIFTDKESKKIEGILINSRIIYIVDSHILSEIKENISFIKFPTNEKKLNSIIDETFFQEKPRILVDEDNYINRIILMSIFKKIGVDVLVVYKDNKNLLETVKDYHVCFIDTRKKLCDKIKSINPRIKIIGVSGNAKTNCTGYDYILKRPVSMNDILSISIV